MSLDNPVAKFGWYVFIPVVGLLIIFGIATQLSYDFSHASQYDGGSASVQVDGQDGDAGLSD